MHNGGIARRRNKDFSRIVARRGKLSTTTDLWSGQSGEPKCELVF